MPTYAATTCMSSSRKFCRGALQSASETSLSIVRPSDVAKSFQVPTLPTRRTRYHATNVRSKPHRISANSWSGVILVLPVRVVASYLLHAAPASRYIRFGASCRGLLPYRDKEPLPMPCLCQLLAWRSGSARQARFAPGGNLGCHLQARRADLPMPCTGGPRRLSDTISKSRVSPRKPGVEFWPDDEQANKFLTLLWDHAGQSSFSKRMVVRLLGTHAVSGHVSSLIPYHRRAAHRARRKINLQPVIREFLRILRLDSQPQADSWRVIEMNGNNSAWHRVAQSNSVADWQRLHSCTGVPQQFNDRYRRTHLLKDDWPNPVMFGEKTAPFLAHQLHGSHNSLR